MGTLPGRGFGLALIERLAEVGCLQCKDFGLLGARRLLLTELYARCSLSISAWSRTSLDC